jgi:toxin-antitoxin system PIN domain toxin
MIFLLDVNVWLALAFESHEHHAAATDWFDKAAPDSCSFCRLVQLGFLRLATNPKAFGKAAVRLVQAWRMYDELLADPRVVWTEEPEALEVFWREYSRRRAFSPKVWNDAYLAAFARAAEFEVVSFDQAFKQYRSLKHTILA